jgi:hypothetical protein
VEQENQARIVNLVYRWTSSTEEIDAETDLAKAEARADEIAVQHLRLALKIIDAKHELAALQKQSDDSHYLFCAAKAKYLELKLATSKQTEGRDPSHGTSQEQGTGENK